MTTAHKAQSCRVRLRKKPGSSRRITVKGASTVGVRKDLKSFHAVTPLATSCPFTPSHIEMVRDRLLCHKVELGQGYSRCLNTCKQ